MRSWRTIRTCGFPGRLRLGGEDGPAAVVPQVKLLFDANLSPRLVTRLADLFPDSISTGLDRFTTDETIWNYARLNGLTIVTADADFLRLSIDRGRSLLQCVGLAMKGVPGTRMLPRALLRERCSVRQLPLADARGSESASLRLGNRLLTRAARKARAYGSETAC